MTKLVAWTWRTLLVLAAAVPVGALIFSWSQSGFEKPMPKSVLESATANPWVFSVFVGLIVLSFIIQYVLGPPTTRKGDVRARTPILVFVGPIVILVISTLAWWQSGDSFVGVVYMVAQRPLMLGSVFGLTIGSLFLAFFMSTRELQKRFLRVSVTLVSVFLIFGGPSYLLYGLQVVKVPYHIAALSGLASIVAGIILFLRFVPKET